MVETSPGKRHRVDRAELTAVRDLGNKIDEDVSSAMMRTIRLLPPQFTFSLGMSGVSAAVRFTATALHMLQRETVPMSVCYECVLEAMALTIKGQDDDDVSVESRLGELLKAKTAPYSPVATFVGRADLDLKGPA